MKITIVQTEIEEAIRNHISSQITINDDMEIDIELRATRGAEGFQADIDIHPKGSGTSSKKAAPKSTNKDKPLGIEDTVAEAKAKPRGRPKSSEPKAEVPEAVQAAKPEPQPQPEPEPEAKAEVAETAPESKPEVSKVSSIFAPKKDETTADTEAKDEVSSDDSSDAEDAEAPKQTLSIFGGMKRPVNA